MGREVNMAKGKQSVPTRGSLFLRAVEGWTQETMA